MTSYNEWGLIQHLLWNENTLWDKKKTDNICQIFLL